MRMVNFETGGAPELPPMKARAGMASRSATAISRHLARAIAQGADLLRIGRSLGQSPAIDLNAVRLLPPVPVPPKILCVGLNYDDHLEESGLKKPASGNLRRSRRV